MYLGSVGEGVGPEWGKSLYRLGNHHFVRILIRCCIVDAVVDEYKTSGGPSTLLCGSPESKFSGCENTASNTIDCEPLTRKLLIQQHITSLMELVLGEQPGVRNITDMQNNYLARYPTDD